MFQRATRLTSAPFRAQAPGLVCGQLYENDHSWRARSPVLAFLLAFRLPPFASWPSCPVPGFRLPCGRPTDGWSAPSDLNGVSMFRTGEIRPVSGASLYPGTVVLTWPASKLRPPLPRLSGHGPVLRWRFHLPEALGNEAYRGSQFVHPSSLPLACNLRMDRRSLGFLPGFTPRRYQRRMPGVGTSVEHSLGANRRSFSTLHFGYLTHTVRPHVALRRTSDNTQVWSSVT